MYRLKQIILKHKRILVIGAGFSAASVLGLVMASWFIIRPSGQYILNNSYFQHSGSHTFYAGLVLGAGVDAKGKPYKELQARLDVGAQAIQKQMVSKLILSGDNRFENYNEPAAMQKYLETQKGIPSKLLVNDYAGRSTYESCERARKLFGQRRILIISARSHLPRAIYLCRKMGIEAYGLPADLEANNSFRRELLARVKALLNVYVLGEKTVLGPPISI